MSEGNWKWQTQRCAHQGGRGELSHFLFTQLYSSSVMTTVSLSKVIKTVISYMNAMITSFFVVLLLFVCIIAFIRVNQSLYSVLISSTLASSINFALFFFLCFLFANTNKLANIFIRLCQIILQMVCVRSLHSPVS